MAQPTKKISAFPAAGALADANIFPILQGGVTKKGTLSDLWSWITSKIGGQNPAPLPRSDNTNWGVGASVNITSAVNTPLVLPNPPGGSTWKIDHLFAVDSATLVVYAYFGNGSNNAVIFAGGATVAIAIAGRYTSVTATRVA